LAYINLHKQKLFNNLDKISSYNKNIIAVIKDNAYGHGIVSFSKMLKEYGIKKVCVRDNKEAEIIKDFFEEIIIFNPHYGMSFANFSYAINSISQLKKTKHKKIHLNIDTGFRRCGVELSELKTALEIIKQKDFELKGVFSHFCCADEMANDTFIQYEEFKKAKEIVKSFGFNPVFHVSNSYALPKAGDKEDFVRVGIAMYGGIEGYEGVMELVGERVVLKELKKGEGCGYNKEFVASEDMKISIIDLGYADGIPYFKNGIDLKNSNAVGKISMDYMCIEGDYKKVIVFDDIKEFVKNFDTITYDILVKISPRIKRAVK